MSCIPVDRDRGQCVIVKTIQNLSPTERVCGVHDSKSRRAFFLTISSNPAKGLEAGPKGQKLWLPLLIKDKANNDQIEKVFFKVEQCWAQILDRVKLTDLEKTVNLVADTPTLYQCGVQLAGVQQLYAQHDQLRQFAGPMLQRKPAAKKEEPKREEGKKEESKRSAQRSSSVPPLPVIHSGSPGLTPQNRDKLQQLGNLSSRSSAERVLSYIATNESRIAPRLSEKNPSVVIPPERSGLKRPVVVHMRQDSEDASVRRPYFYLHTQNDPKEGGFKQVDDMVDVTRMRTLASLRPIERTRRALVIQEKELRILQLMKGKKGIAQLKDSILHQGPAIGPYRKNTGKWLELLLIKYAKGDLLTYLKSTNVNKLIRLRIAHDIACGLIALHGEGIVHRDLKPSNVLVGEENSGVFGALTDFGIATEGRKNMAVRVDNCWGTPGYFAPEVEALKYMDGHADGKAADIWSLGKLFRRLFTLGDGGLRLEQEHEISDLIRCMMNDKPKERYNAERVAAILQTLIQRTNIPAAQPAPVQLPAIDPAAADQRPFSAPAVL